MGPPGYTVAQVEFQTVDVRYNIKECRDQLPIERMDDEEKKERERVQPSYQKIVIPSLARRRRRDRIERGDGCNMYQGIEYGPWENLGRIYQRLCP